MLADDTSKATLAVTLIMETRGQGNSRAIDEGNTITAGIDVLRDQTKLRGSIHGLCIDSTTNDIVDCTDDCIFGHL